VPWLAIVAAAGCADNQMSAAQQAAPPGTNPVEANALPIVPGEKSLVFFDADVFDLTFADELKLGTDQIHVDFAGPTSLNAFPARMNVWLAEIKKTDGTVTVVDPSHPTASRGLFGVGIIFDLIDAVNTMQERHALSRRLALAHVYNAKILYDSSNGMAREVLFTRRPPAPAEMPPAAGPAPITGPAPTTSGT
jgi:hypothetical protein